MSEHDHAAPVTVPPIVGGSITPEMELQMLAMDLPKSAMTADAAKWAIVEIDRLRDKFKAIKESLSGHQHVDCNRCVFCAIMRQCDAALSTSNITADRIRRSPTENQTKAGEA